MFHRKRSPGNSMSGTSDGDPKITPKKLISQSVINKILCCHFEQNLLQKKTFTMERGS